MLLNIVILVVSGYDLKGRVNNKKYIKLLPEKVVKKHHYICRGV